MPTINLRPADGGQPIKFTYEGATIGDATPAGAALELMAAQFEQDRAKCLRLLAASSRVMVPPDTTPPAPFFGDVEFQVNEVAIDGIRATARMSMRSAMTGDQPLPYAMACVQEMGAWRVDLMATMELAMSTMQGALGSAQQGIEQLGDAVGNLQDLLKKLGAQTPEEDSGNVGSK
jgi:hypothetical protein